MKVQSKRKQRVVNFDKVSLVESINYEGLILMVVQNETTSDKKPNLSEPKTFNAVCLQKGKTAYKPGQLMMKLSRSQYKYYDGVVALENDYDY